MKIWTDERVEDAACRYASGATLQEVGQVFGITRERQRQVLHKFCRIRIPFEKRMGFLGTFRELVMLALSTPK